MLLHFDNYRNCTIYFEEKDFILSYYLAGMYINILEDKYQNVILKNRIL